jgi:hypothetical protein
VNQDRVAKSPAPAGFRGRAVLVHPDDRARPGRHFGADPAGADDHQAHTLTQPGAQVTRLVDRAQRHRPVSAASGRQEPGPRTGRDEQRVEVEGALIGRQFAIGDPGGATAPPRLAGHLPARREGFSDT